MTSATRMIPITNYILVVVRRTCVSTDRLVLCFTGMMRDMKHMY